MNDESEQIILVDSDDNEVGVLGKLETHRLGLRHRAISVCITNARGEMLLQRRALEKYHSGGLWTNACCTHPRQGETTADAAARRLREELGVGCALRFLFVTHYRAAVGEGLIEDEMVHLFQGEYDGPLSLDPSEAVDYTWLSREKLTHDIAQRPQAYTYWFRHYVRSHADAIFERAA